MKGLNTGGDVSMVTQVLTGKGKIWTQVYLFLKHMLFLLLYTIFHPVSSNETPFPTTVLAFSYV